MSPSNRLKYKIIRHVLNALEHLERCNTIIKIELTPNKKTYVLPHRKARLIKACIDESITQLKKMLTHI